MNTSPTLPTSFLGKTGRFYVLRNEGLNNPIIPKKYMIYSSIEAYNRRKEIPEFGLAEEVITDFDQELKIYPESLTTTPPSYERELDRTDLGLSNPINTWHKRFQRQREGQKHEA